MPELIPSDAVKAIQAGVAVEQIEIDGSKFTTREVYLPPKEPLPSQITLRTLTGLVEFVNQFKSSGNIDHIHVESAGKVYVAGKLEGRHNQRAYYANASRIAGGKFAFGDYLDQEDFIIRTQSCFVPTEQRAALLSLVGNLRDEAVNQQEDDGVTQTVATRRGVSLVSVAKVPNPITLAPWRTFPEIAQPSSPFILRVRRGPEIALFETADVAWELEAIQAIADFLSKKIEGVTIIA